MNKFKKNLLFGYAFTLLLLIASSVSSYISIQNLLYSQRMVDHTNEVIRNLDDVVSELIDAETGQRGFLLTGNREFLEPFIGSVNKTNNSLDKVKELTVDNLDQQRSIEQLRTHVNNRITRLQELIDNKKKGVDATVSELSIGKKYMDQARALVKQMEDRENALLHARTESMNKFVVATPMFIIVASLLSIIITIVSYFRINSDYTKRELLQTELEKKDKDISKRLNLIQGIAEKISSGNYKTRVTDEGKDVLGSLSVSLNKMAESLELSFNNLSDKEWFQTGIAILNEKMIAEKNIGVLSYNILEFLTEYTRSPVGAFYIVNDMNLTLASGVALDKTTDKTLVRMGEGFIGQVARSRKMAIIENIEGHDILFNYTAGAIKPKTLLALPIIHEGKLKGVIELASLEKFNNITQEFLKSAAYTIATSLHAAQDHDRLQELLMETQSQSEELQSQHSELESINSELEAQAEKLQVSEEELRVQQEELQQSNVELEERSRLLEEKNELILERNLEIQKKAEELEISTKYKSEFLANMSHELRTPLNSILLLSRLLSENHAGNLTAEEIEYAAVIQSSGKGLLTLIDEILDLSKIESGKMELEVSEFKIEQVTAELKAMFTPIAKEKGLEFSISLAEDLPASIETDKTRLEQIIRNFIGNALKFTKKGGLALTISRNDSSILFSVKDTGIGIAAEKQQTIFEAFQQADGSTRRQYGGTGLGLSISRELAKFLGGEIHLVSEEGKGSEFILILPLDKKITEVKKTKPSPPKKKIEEPEYKNANKKYISADIPSAIEDDRNRIEKNDKVILIIEDDTDFAYSLLTYTRKKGYKCLVAVRGDEGVEMAKQFLPLCILLDVQLPVKSGWEVMEELKADNSTRPIPVHMMSAHEVKLKSLSKGAIDFINKPVAFEKLGEMFQKIEHALSHHPKKVLIVEENSKHAQALAYFLETHNIRAEIRNTINEGIEALNNENIDCVILDMGIASHQSYEILEEVKRSPGFENLPIIVFTGRNISLQEEIKIKQYADTIVVKTAHSYQRILDEVSLFLHLVEENKPNLRPQKYNRLGDMSEVLKGKTVLLADDDVRNIFSLSKSLEKYHMNVISAMDGKDAIKQLEENPQIDIILMDMMMPEMDGYDSTKKIRENSKYKKLPIIAVTAKAMAGDREKSIESGASDYITKPVDVDQLISLLRVWLYN